MHPSPANVMIVTIAAVDCRRCHLSFRVSVAAVLLTSDLLKFIALTQVVAAARFVAAAAIILWIRRLRP